MEQLIHLLGKPINSPEIKLVLEQYKLKYPKKDFITNKSSDRTYWIENNKLGIALYFQLQSFSLLYSPLPGEKKGHFIPYLTKIKWTNNKTNFQIPYSLSFDLSFNEIVTILGVPTIKSSDVATVWINDDGSESFYRWFKTIDRQKDTVFMLEYNNDKNSVRSIEIGIEYRTALLFFYDELNYETFESYKKTTDSHDVASMMFLEWAACKKWLKAAINEVNIINEMEAGNRSGYDYIRSIQRGFIIKDDFTANHDFIRKYIKNLFDNDASLYADFARQYLKNNKLFDNYFGKEAQEELNKVELNLENRAIMWEIFEGRLAEFESGILK